MKIKVGSYLLFVADGYLKSKKQAKELFLTHYPLVTEKDLDNELDKLFTDADKSDNTSNENTDGDKQYAETGSGGTGKKQSGKDKHQ